MALKEVFLIVLCLIWIAFAVIQDLRKREIANWLNFSLIIFAIAFRFFFSLFSEEGFGFFYQGLIGFAIFFVIGNMLYYGRVFAGGDAKLMIALGAIIPLSNNFPENLNIMLKFLLLFLVSGALYGIIFGVALGLKDKKKFSKDFASRFKKHKKIFYISIIVSIVFLVLSFVESLFLYLGILFFISPYIYFFAKSIDESCMVKKVNTKELTEGDWLYKDVKIGKRVIEAHWEGLSSSEIQFLRKNMKFVSIRQGIPFSPVFLISYLVLIIFFI